MRPPQGGLVQVGFEEIAMDLLEARFWIASGWPTIQELSYCGSEQDAESRQPTAPSAVDQSWPHGLCIGSVIRTLPVYRAV